MGYLQQFLSNKLNYEKDSTVPTPLMGEVFASQAPKPTDQEAYRDHWNQVFLSQRGGQAPQPMDTAAQQSVMDTAINNGETWADAPVDNYQAPQGNPLSEQELAAVKESQNMSGLEQAIAQSADPEMARTLARQAMANNKSPFGRIMGMFGKDTYGVGEAAVRNFNQYGFDESQRGIRQQTTNEDRLARQNDRDKVGDWRWGMDYNQKERAMKQRAELARDKLLNGGSDATYSTKAVNVLGPDGKPTGVQVFPSNKGGYKNQYGQDYTLKEGETLDNTNRRVNETVGNFRYIDKAGNEVVRSAVRKGSQAFFRTSEGLVPLESVLSDNELSQGRWVNQSETQDVEKRKGGIPNAISYSESFKIPSFDFQREGEQKAYSMVLRAVSAEKEINDLTTKVIQETGSADSLTSLSNKFKEWAAGNANTGITAAVINTIVGETVPQSMQSAYKRFLQAVLRNDTGAAYTGTEIADYMGAFMPSAGDTKEAVQAKRNARLMELAAQAGKTGSAAPYLIGLIDGTYELPNVSYAIKQASQYDSVGKPNDTPKVTDDDLIMKYLK